MTFLGLTIDMSFWQWFLDLPLPDSARVIFALGGWTILAYIFFVEGAKLWVEYREKVKYMSKWQWVLLAVDIPALFIQTPKAVEQIFAHLSGALASINVYDKFWRGKKQKWFSFEIVSIEGYIQFLVRTELEFRDLLEASIYAQYTEAEITEVEDYVGNIPDRFPSEDYNVMGVEFKLEKDDAYPIRVYSEFEYSLSKEAVFSDPMAAILENFSRIGNGENLWMELILEPISSKWKEKGIELVKKLLGQEKKSANTIISFIGGLPLEILKEFLNAVNPREKAEEKKPERKEITPGEKETVEAIEEKISKIGFKSKLRVIYAARHEVFNPSRCLDGFVGAMNQFSLQNRNSLIPSMGTYASYDRKQKKTNLLRNTFVKVFKNRKMKWKTFSGYIFNIEELATIWHFPLPFVKTPLLQKAGYKRAEPPTGLPTEILESPLRKKGGQVEEKPSTPSTAPENLPYG